MGAIGTGAATGAAGGIIAGSFVAGVFTFGIGTVVGLAIGAALGAGVAALGTVLGRTPGQPFHRSSDIITTSTTQATPVAVAFGRNRAGGNIIAVGAFWREKNPLKGVGNYVFRSNFILAICEGGPPPLFQGIADSRVLTSLIDPNYYPFGNIRIDGQLPLDLANVYNVSTRRNFQYRFFPGTNVQTVPDFVLDGRRGYNMYPHVPWRNTMLMECYFLCGTPPRLQDVNIDFVGPDWTIRRNGKTAESNPQDVPLYAFYDSYTEAYCYTIDSSTSTATPFGLTIVGRQDTPLRSHTPPPYAVTDSVALAWYLGRHDVLVMQDPGDSSTFHVGYLGIARGSKDWEVHKPDPGYAQPITRWHLDEAHGILHTYHEVTDDKGFILRWWLLTGRIERTNTDSLETDHVGFLWSSDLNCYVTMGAHGMHFIDPITGLTFKNSSAISSSGILGLCISGTMVGAIKRGACTYFDLVSAATFGPYGNNTGNSDKGHLGEIISVHQNSFTGHVTLTQPGADGNVVLINFIPSVVEDIRDVNANGTSSLGQDPLNDAIGTGTLNGNPEPDFQVFSFDPVTKWVRDWSVRETQNWYLNSLEGVGSLAAALWASSVDEINLDSARWGGGMDASYFNLGSFEGLHWYCVGGVKMANPDGTYRRAERYKYENMLTSEVNVSQFCSEHVLMVCNGWRTVVCGQLHVGVNKSGQWPLWHFNDRNVDQKKGMQVAFIGPSKTVNRVRVQYRDILTEYRSSFAQAQSHWDIQRRNKVQLATISAEGCGRYGQAYNLANAILNETLGGRHQTTHETHFVGWMFTTGDPVEISNEQTALVRMPARITEIKEESDILEFICLQQIGPLDATAGIGVGGYSADFNGSQAGPPSPADSLVQVEAPIDGSTVWLNGGAMYMAGPYSITYQYGTYRPQTGVDGMTGAPISTYNNAVYGYEIITRNDVGAITVIDYAPGIQVSSPGWPTPVDAEAANVDQTKQFTLAADGPIGIRLPDNATALAGAGYTLDETPSTPTYTVTPIAMLGVPAGQPDPALLPNSLTISHTGSNAYDAMAYWEAPVETGTRWNGVLGNETGYLLYYFFSLDPASKTIFGTQPTGIIPPIGYSIIVYPGTAPGGTMWLEQVVLAWYSVLPTSRQPGWMIQFYAGTANTIPQVSHGFGPTGNPNPTANTGAIGDAIMVWQGELVSSDPRGTYTRSAASPSLVPATMVIHT